MHLRTGLPPAWRGSCQLITGLRRRACYAKQSDLASPATGLALSGTRQRNGEVISLIAGKLEDRTP